MQRPASPWKIVYLLAVTQVVSWGSLYYAFSIVAHDIRQEFGWSTELVFGAFSLSLLVSGLASTPAGMLLDRFGGRWVMGAGSLLAGGGLLLLATTHEPVQYFAAWILIGVAMALALYDAAFATINREFFADARKGISVLTLFGGLASTVFWPLTLKLNTAVGWRDTFMVFGIVHLALCLPLHLLLPVSARRPRAAADAAGAARDYTLREALRDATFWKLAFAFSANVFIFSALSAHLIPMLQRFGHSAGIAVLAASLIGPMQVAGRLGEMTFARHVAPQNVGKVVFGLLPVALLALTALGEFQLAIAAFCILYGVSNGILTIVRGTIPQTLFGREHYGAISGAMSGPGLIAKAGGPLIAAAFVGAHQTPTLLLGVLFAVSVVSLLCYLAAIRSERGGEMFEASEPG
ncbi:MFS transporter [Oxalobacteraceae bacterium OM1]|nr:MFS transporter [Oxalobacteraceae bacterium OM1]